MIHVSALTIAAGRAAHLRNVVTGFQAQHHKPSELIIGVMQDDDYTDLPATDFPIRQIRVTAPELPLSAARNAVADAATGELLVFVDVMKELPATFVMRPFNFDTLAVQAYNLASDERLAEASTAALTIVVVGLLPLIVLSRMMLRPERTGAPD